MLRKLVTGGQAGTEQAAWASARRAGVETGGYMPRGFLTEEGPAPRLGALYGAIEFPFDDARRIRANLRRADGLFWFGDADSPGAADVFAACRELGKPFLVVHPRFADPAEAADWLQVFEIGVLVAAGEPTSRSPEIGPLVGAFLDRVIAKLRSSPPRGRR
ncbi:YpsA SLOG family protein [Paludisphaera soli]|uniref:YpsA SLOG family protein n=1 Tax=Paludisphaera soli TaxID=2712865 RepID=UPI0013EC59A3|nr:putative molybdenum carrier protein [Paludisphaera soli]